jgi:hypothetical protein
MILRVFEFFTFVAYTFSIIVVSLRIPLNVNVAVGNKCIGTSYVCSFISNTF